MIYREIRGTDRQAFSETSNRWHTFSKADVPCSYSFTLRSTSSTSADCRNIPSTLVPDRKIIIRKIYNITWSSWNSFNVLSKGERMQCEHHNQWLKGYADLQYCRSKFNQNKDQKIQEKLERKWDSSWKEDPLGNRRNCMCRKLSNTAAGARYPKLHVYQLGINW